MTKYSKPLLVATGFSISFIIIGFICFCIGFISGDLGFAFTGLVMLAIGFFGMGQCLRVVERYEDGKKTV